VPLVVGSSEEALASLARLDARTREDPDLERVARALPAEERAVAGIRSAAATAPTPVKTERDLAELETEVLRSEERLAALDSALGARAQQFQTMSAELSRLRAIWQATGASPETAAAPERVRDRVAMVNARIGEAEAGRQAYLSHLIDLQDRLAVVRADLGVTASEVRQARRTLDRQLFEAESAPLWQALRSIPAGDDVRRARAVARLHLLSVRDYLATGDVGIWLELVFLGLLTVGLQLLRRAPVAGARDSRVASVLRHPLLTATVAALLLTPLFQPRAPTPLFAAAVLAAAVPWILVSREVVPRRLLAPQLVVTALFVMDRFAGLAPAHALSIRLMLLGTSVAGAALAASGLRRGGWASELREGGWGTAARAGLWASLVLLTVAVLANVIGNVTLASRLARGTLSSALAGMLAGGVVLLARAALAAALQLPAAQRRRLVALHGPLLERRCGQVARWGAFALWAWSAAASFRVAGPALALASAVLDRRLSVGSLRVSLRDVVAFGVTLWIAVVLSRLVRFVLDEGVFPTALPGRGLHGAISKTAQYAVLGLGLLAAIYASGVELSRFSLFAGTLGVGIGFGLQNIVNNFVSGLILYERPVQPGDIVEVGAVAGEVRRIGVRSSTVRTFQGADVIVPNATLISTEVVNWTLTDRTRRVEVAVSVAYGSDPELVRHVLLEAVQRGDVLREPVPEVFLTRFGESALEFEVRFWPQRFETWVRVASEVRGTILRELARAGVTIPFPQRDVHVRSGNELPDR